MFVEHKEAVEVTEAPAKIAKLSQAIRIGSTYRPQGRSYYLANGATCALGAAWEALHGPLHGTEYNCSAFEMLRSFGLPGEMHNEIAYRNDIEGWTREQIADWLEAQGL